MIPFTGNSKDYRTPVPTYSEARFAGSSNRLGLKVWRLNRREVPLTLNENRIRVRAYFHFENRTGWNWRDSVSNWLQAEQDEQSLSYFELQNAQESAVLRVQRLDHRR
jgi:hypothetical protein